VEEALKHAQWQAIGEESLITRRLRILRRSDCRRAAVCSSQGSFWEKGGYWCCWLLLELWYWRALEELCQRAYELIWWSCAQGSAIGGQAGRDVVMVIMDVVSGMVYE
jgi:hypothetical protein